MRAMKRGVTWALGLHLPRAPTPISPTHCFSGSSTDPWGFGQNTLLFHPAPPVGRPQLTLTTSGPVCVQSWCWPAPARPCSSRPEPSQLPSLVLHILIFDLTWDVRLECT